MPKAQQKRDYYEVLELDRSATRDQIKQAYRQLALQYHPDRNKEPGATEKFREIAEAYAVLSDDTKRREYDVAGHAGIDERWSPEDLMRGFHFGDFFGGRFDDLSGIFGDFFGGPTRRTHRETRGADLRYDIDLTLDEAAKGGDREFTITRREMCRACQGSGAKPGTKPITCHTCGGSGQKQRVQSKQGMKMVSITPCPDCQGTGKKIDQPCPTCQATGLQTVPHTIKVHLPPGIDDGMMIRLSGQGEVSREGGVPGDLFIRPHLRPHSSLQRQGDDVYAVSSIHFADAALGTKVQISGLTGKQLVVKVPPGTQSGTALRLPGKGMPRLNRQGKGDLFVVVEVRTPSNLTSRQRELLEEFQRLERERAG